MQNQQTNQNIQPGLPKVASNKTVKPVVQKTEVNIPEVDFTPEKYQSDGYGGVKGKTNYSYDPRDESMVENRITGLLDPDSDLMRKAISQANNYSASRGLQSSTIANETALSSMIDKALPIASQDANTYAQADQTGWNNSFTAAQNNLARKHDASMFDKNANFQTQLQNNQFGFQAASDYANKQMQNELQKLQYEQQQGLLDAEGQQRLVELEKQQEIETKLQELKQQNQLGLLDAEGQQRLQEIEKASQIQNERDKTLQEYQNQNLDKQYLQDLEKTKLQYQQQDDMFAQQVSAQTAADYRNATSSTFNAYMEQVAAIYSNPNMTSSQQSAGINKLKQQFDDQRSQLQVIYGYADEGESQQNDQPSSTNTSTTQSNTPPPPYKHLNQDYRERVLLA